jgi:hypothetical protein
LPVLVADLDSGLLEGEAGGVYQNIGAAELFQHGVAKAIDGSAAGDIGEMHQGAAIAPENLVADAFHPFGPPAGGHNVGSMACQTEGDGAADAGSSADYHGHAIGQVQAVSHHARNR